MLIFAALLGVCGSAPADRIQDLIQGLGDADPARRQRAAQELLQSGPSARPALVAAARTEDTSIATAAAELLLSLPWTDRTDPPAVQEALRSYGNPEPSVRANAATQIASKYPRPVANQVLLRLLLEEPSEDVCWRIVSLLRQSFDEPTCQALKKVDITQNRASALVLSARACFVADRERARKLLRRAIEIEQRNPSADGGELDFAFDALAGAAINGAEYDQAARIRRTQSARAFLSTSEGESPVHQLFALHARYGPLGGFEQDLATYSLSLGEPQILYAIAVAAERRGLGAAAAACTQAAAFSSISSPQRALAAQFLRRHQFNDLAEVELYAILNGTENSTAIERVRARFALADLAGRRDDHATSAKHLQAVLDLIDSEQLQIEVTDSTGRRMPFDPLTVRSRISWRLFRAAEQLKDQTTAQRHLKDLLANRTWNSEIVVDMVPYLKSIGRHADAKAMFEPEYRNAQARLAQDPQRAVLKNDLAWLCARSGEKLDEALLLAGSAVESAPAEPSFLDTLAEAHYQLGHGDQAVRLEEAALELEPGDPFMLRQLERFKNPKSAN